MARKIDFSKPLSAEEQAYVADRPWLLQDAKLRGEDIITDDQFSVDDDEDTNDDGASDATGDAGSDEGSSEEDGDDSGTEDETDDESGDDVDEDSEEDGEGDEEEVAPYDQWDYADLKTEAGNRGLSKAGSKEQLIERLQEDDGSAPE